MIPQSVHDRGELAKLLRRDPQLHAYALGDLDDFFWPYTTWYERSGSVVLVYHGGGFPAVLAFDRDLERLRALLQDVRPLLPQRFYTHVSAGAETVFGAGELHLKLALTDPRRLMTQVPMGEPLSQADLGALEKLYAQAYPGNSFVSRMLDTGHYFGMRHGDRLVAVAGVHVYSAAYGVAAIGNVTTHPDVRGRGIGKAVVAALCRRLLETTDEVTLNVKADNASAIALYTALGFTPIAEYYEMWVETT